MKQTARQTEAYDLAKGTLGREGEVGRLASQAQSIVATIPRCSTAARGNLIMFDIHHRPRKRNASETGVRRCIGFV